VTSVFRLKSCLDCNGKSNFCISFVPLIFPFVLSLDLSSVLRIRSCWCYEIYCPSFLPPPGFGPRHFCVLFLTASPPVRSGLAFFLRAKRANRSGCLNITDRSGCLHGSWFRSLISASTTPSLSQQHIIPSQSQLHTITSLSPSQNTPSQSRLQTTLTIPHL
jgi:hypothetical protein